MNIKTDLATIKLVEINDSLKERNRDNSDGRQLTTGYRVVVSFQNDELSAKEAELLSRIVDEKKRELMRKTMLNNRTEIRYSGVFNAEDILEKQDGSPFETPKEGYSNEQQDEICKLIKEKYALMDNKNIFTVITFSISELLCDVPDYSNVTYLLYEDLNGVVSKIADQSRLFFGFFDDTESAKNMIRRSLLSRIENKDLAVPPTTDNTKEATKETAKDNNPLANLIL